MVRITLVLSLLAWGCSENSGVTSAPAAAAVPDEGTNTGIMLKRDPAQVATPVIDGIARSADGDSLTVRFAASPLTDIVDYRIEWIVGVYDVNNKRHRRRFAEKAIASSSPYTFAPTWGGDVSQRPWKVRVQSRTAAKTATHRREGVWSSIHYIPAHINDSKGVACTASLVMTPGDNCYTTTGRNFRVYPANGHVEYGTWNKSTGAPGAITASSLSTTKLDHWDGFGATRGVGGDDSKWTVTKVP